jgi:putative ABC transport system permease protein
MGLHAWREGWRSLRQDWRLTVTAVALLAVTIGAVTAVFAVAQGIVFRPFPFVDQDRIAIVWQRDDRRAVPIMEVSYGEMAQWRARTRDFAHLAVVSSTNWGFELQDGGEPLPVEIAGVSSSFFPVVGTKPQLGRWLVDEDDQGESPRAMVISHGLWTRRFGADPSLVGRAVRVKLGAEAKPIAITVAGVMPPVFDYPKGAEAWVPARPLIRTYGVGFSGGADNAERWLGVFLALGRLRDGVPFDRATQELTGIMRTSDRQKGPQAAERLVVTPLASHLLGPAGPVLRTLLAGAILMLLIACANVAGLQVSRAARRERALAIRSALGASGRRLATQVACESALVTLAALAGAAAVAAVTVRGLIALAPDGVPRLADVALLDWRVAAFGGAITFVTVALCALWPIVVARRVDAASILASSAPRATDPRGRRLQRGIVVGQMAVALTLLAGTGLFVRTVRGLDRTILGFDPTNLLAFTVSPPTSDRPRYNQVFEAALPRIAAAPGVRGVGAVLLRPLSGPIGWDNQPMFPGQVPTDPKTFELNPHTNFEVVTPDYFRTMGIRLVRGRLFDARDTEASPGVVIVNETAAARFWPGKDAIGQQLREPTFLAPGGPTAPGWQTVVGVVADVRYRGLTDPRLDLYAPWTQSKNLVQHVMVRTSGDTASVVAAVKAAVGEADPKAQVAEAVVMQDVVAAESAPWRFLVQVFLAFAGLAALLATIGLGAVVAIDVTARGRELAIRSALGADAACLRRLVLRDAGRLIAVGIAAGLAIALILGRAVAHVLIGIGPHDVVALAAAAALAVGAGLLATWLPARRAGRANAVDALKAE